MFRTPIHMLRWAPLTVALVMCAQAAANAQAQGPRVLKVGTTFVYEGVMVPEGRCEEYVPYQQCAKVSGQVILPETTAHVYSLVEYWGRDSSHQILRISPSGRTFLYFNRTEFETPSLGVVGSSSELTDPESGQTLRLVIEAADLTITLPTGAVYDNVTRMNMYCVSCGSQPVLMESQWFSPEHPLPVLFRADNTPCWPRWHWLVSVTGK